MENPEAVAVSQAFKITFHQWFFSLESEFSTPLRMYDQFERFDLFWSFLFPSLHRSEVWSRVRYGIRAGNFYFSFVRRVSKYQNNWINRWKGYLCGSDNIFIAEKKERFYQLEPTRKLTSRQIKEKGECCENFLLLNSFHWNLLFMIERKKCKTYCGNSLVPKNCGLYFAS